MDEKLARMWQRGKETARKFKEHFREYPVADTEMIVGAGLIVVGMIAGVTVNEKIMILLYPGFTSLFLGAVTYGRQAYAKINAGIERSSSIKYARDQGLKLPGDEEIIDVKSADPKE